MATEREMRERRRLEGKVNPYRLCPDNVRNSFYDIYETRCINPKTTVVETWNMAIDAGFPISHNYRDIINGMR